MGSVLSVQTYGWTSQHNGPTNQQSITCPSKVPKLKTMVAIGVVTLAQAIQLSAAHARGTLGPGFPSPPGNEHPIAARATAVTVVSRLLPS